MSERDELVRLLRDLGTQTYRNIVEVGAPWNFEELADEIIECGFHKAPAVSEDAGDQVAEVIRHASGYTLDGHHIARALAAAGLLVSHPVTDEATLKRVAVAIHTLRTGRIDDGDTREPLESFDFELARAAIEALGGQR